MDHYRTIRRDVHVRLPDDLYKRLRMVAESEQRSIAGQVAAILRERLDGRTTITFSGGRR